jgi:hypothetical protein
MDRALACNSSLVRLILARTLVPSVTIATVFLVCVLKDCFGSILNGFTSFSHARRMPHGKVVKRSDGAFWNDVSSVELVVFQCELSGEEGFP